jgi:hypothetical protein
LEKFMKGKRKRKGGNRGEVVEARTGCGGGLSDVVKSEIG